MFTEKHPFAGVFQNSWKTILTKFQVYSLTLLQKGSIVGDFLAILLIFDRHLRVTASLSSFGAYSIVFL